MTDIWVRQKPIIIGIMGSHEDGSPAVDDAFVLGKAVAQRGYVLLTGGGRGVMKAASEGACLAGGLVIAVLPSERNLPLNGYPNEFVDIPIYTGMYDARNVINAKTPSLIIALSGSAGTLSEIAIALKSGTAVIGLNCPRFELPATGEYYPVTTVEEAIGKMDELVAQCGGSRSEPMKHHHVAVACSRRDRAEQFYGKILGLSLIKTTSIGGDLAERIFDAPDTCDVILFGNEHCAIEVFVTGTAAPKAGTYAHVCLEVQDKRHCADVCESQGFDVRRIPRGDDLMIFIRDYDGNLFEIKEAPRAAR